MKFMQNRNHNSYAEFVIGTKIIKHVWLSNLSSLSIPDEGYSRNMLCTLNLISKVFIQGHTCNILLYFCFIKFTGL